MSATQFQQLERQLDTLRQNAKRDERRLQRELDEAERELKQLYDKLVQSNETSEYWRDEDYGDDGRVLNDKGTSIYIHKEKQVQELRFQMQDACFGQLKEKQKQVIAHQLQIVEAAMPGCNIRKMIDFILNYCADECSDQWVRPPSTLQELGF